jgi:hypothetical protein
MLNIVCVQRLSSKINLRYGQVFQVHVRVVLICAQRLYSKINLGYGTLYDGADFNFALYRSRLRSPVAKFIVPDGGIKFRPA